MQLMSLKTCTQLRMNDHAETAFLAAPPLAPLDSELARLRACRDQLATFRVDFERILTQRNDLMHPVADLRQELLTLIEEADVLRKERDETEAERRYAVKVLTEENDALRAALERAGR